MSCWRFANEWLLNGEKICRPITWQKHSYWFKSEEGVIMYCDGTPAQVHLNQINADDWEIWEEDETLSYYSTMVNDKYGLFYPEPEVKKAIKRLREELLIDGSYCREIDNKIIEIFGTKLTEEEKW